MIWVIIGWIILGVVAGFIASKIVNRSGEGFVGDLILGIIGAVVGGFLFNQFGLRGAGDVSWYSLFVAVIGAVIVLWIYHAIVRRRSSL